MLLKRNEGNMVREDLSRTHVWVHCDLVDAILENDGALPKGWKFSRKRCRTDNKFDWGWVRGYISQKTHSSNNNEDESTTVVKHPASPYGHVKLRKVKNSPIANGISQSPGSPFGSPQRRQQQRDTIWSITIQDSEFAPYELRNKTFSVDPNGDGAAAICMANTWWQSSSLQDEGPPDDLCRLTHLHEPAVVYCLKERYKADVIYTYTGKILLALNPFRVCPGLYGEAAMRPYWDTSNNETRLAPHIYAVAQDAYGTMRRVLEMSSPVEGPNQSILVSGESGAGKTETTKIIMQYLATLSQRHMVSPSKKGGIEAQVLQSNPILESFGNARTVRNDNSSRFGKYIEIQFSKEGCLLSASIETYLLEKVRLISQASGERNFHIFYELLAGLPQKERRDLRVGNVTAKDFRITSGSGTFDRRDGVDDRDTFRDLRKALDTIGFSETDQKELFTVVCGLLHASNLTFVEETADSSELDRGNISLRSALALLGVRHEALENSLCLCAIEARGETLYKNLSVPQATKALEALIKATYGALFSHIVSRVNASIAAGHMGDHVNKDDLQTASIGVLDIFGFESFAKNSLEQLCINYCNEALQQQFNRFVFKLEQKEYESEGIEWSFVTFPDNQDILDLVEQRPSGLLSILDEQCRIPRSTDMKFARAAYETCKDHPRFEASKSQQVSGTFSVDHYAGFVEYDTENFLEKNKDELSRETTNLLVASSNAFVASLGNLLQEIPSRCPSPILSDVSGGSGRRPLRRTASSIMRESVGSQFAFQLRELRERIDKTTPHYVRCLKPNDDLVPKAFHPTVIADQLRCAGVLEAIRVSRVGFPQRYTHSAFVERYHMLAVEKMCHFFGVRKGKDLCEVLVNAISAQMSDSENGGIPTQRQNLTNHGIQMGRTKVFLRREAFEKIEHLRRRKTESSATLIQSNARGVLARQKYQKLIAAVMKLQSFHRRIEAMRYSNELRRSRSAVAIQCAWRGFVAERNLMAALTIAQWCQSTSRGIAAREICAFMLLDYKAKLIQKKWRGYCVRREFLTVIRSIVRIQSLHRMKKPKLELKRLKAEARDLDAISAERDRFRSEARRLQIELENQQTQLVVSPKSEDSDEVERLRREVELLQLQLKKAHFSNGPETVHAGGHAVASPDFATDTKGHTSPPSPQLSPIKRSPFPTRMIRGSPDKTVSTLGSPMGRSFESSNLTPQQRRKSPGALLRTPPPKSPDEVKLFSDQSSPRRRHMSSTKSATSVSLLDGEENHDIETFSPPRTNRSSSTIAPLGSPRSMQISLPSTNGSNSIESHGPFFHEEAFEFRKAIRLGDENTVRMMLDDSQFAELLIHDCDHNGSGPLHIATAGNYEFIVHFLLERDGVANAQDHDGNTPLHLAESASMVQLLLEVGRANPNIPNSEGICALHLAVNRLDVESVKEILSRRADVNAADHARWYTALHLVAQSEDEEDDAVLGKMDNGEKSARGQIADLLCEVTGPSKPDLDFQDTDGNTPLHHAAMLTTAETDEVIVPFLEHGADANVSNKRGQTPLHLLCHNDSLRKFDMFQEILHDMLFHGADPNQPSLTGCTALHLSLYHRDIDSAIQLIHNGAELHLLWRKPKRWKSFWDDMGTSEILALDMVEDEHSLHRLLAAITKPQKWAPSRPWCMQCKAILGTFARALHCRHCGRNICGSCSPRSLHASFFPKSFEVYESSWVCTVCEKILVARKEDSTSSSTQPTSSQEDEELDLHSF